MKLQDDLNSIKQARDNIKQAIENKGQTVNKDIRTFAEAISKISGGGSTEGVKLFETVEQMQADPLAKEGDLAVVYRSEMRNWDGEGTITGANFPETVVLPEAFTDSAMVSLRSDEGMFDCWGNLSQDRFNVSIYSDSGEAGIEYTSSDGITYTRTDGGDTYIDFGCEVHFESWGEPFNLALGYFFQIGGNVYEGLYRAENKLTHTVNYNYRLENGEVKYDSVEYDFDQLCEDLKFPHLGGSTLKLVSNYAEGKPTRYWSSGYGNQCLIHYNGHIYFGCTCASSENITSNFYVYYRDIGGSDVFPNISTANMVTINSTKYYIFTASETVDDISVRYFCDNAGSAYYPMYYISDNTVYNIPIIANTGNYYPQWELAKTQIDATAEYVYGKTFYGKNGVEEGTLGNPDNTFIDNNAKLIVQIQQKYEEMEPRVLTNDNKQMNRDVQFIPAKKDGTPLLDTSNVTNMEGMFYTCINLISIPLLDTSNVTRMYQMFWRCYELETIPLLNTSKVTTMYEMFSGCWKLKSVPQFNTSRVTDMTGMFGGCKVLQTIPLLDTSNVMCTSYMFEGCEALTDVPLLDTSSVELMYHMFYRCLNLTTESLNNILAMCKNAVKITSNKTLLHIGLSLEQANICKTLSNYSVFTAAGWTTGY